MKERPILFSGEMVRAILDGRKSQTRRVIKPQPKLLSEFRKRLIENPCPYGKPGDRLWVRETWYSCHDISEASKGGLNHWHFIKYANDSKIMNWPEGSPNKNLMVFCKDREYCAEIKKPSIHMPRWASRILLEITDIRVERVQDISEEDAEREGGPRGYDKYQMQVRDCREWFQRVWDSINKKRGYGWDANPWCWIIIFRRIK